MLVLCPGYGQQDEGSADEDAARPDNEFLSASDSEAPSGTGRRPQRPGQGEARAIVLDDDCSDDEIEESDGGSRGNAAWAPQQPRPGGGGGGGGKRAAAPAEPPGQQPPKRGRRGAAAEGCARMSSYFSKLPLGGTRLIRLQPPCILLAVFTPQQGLQHYFCTVIYCKFASKGS